MKRILTLTLLTISSLGFSQSEPQFTLFWNNYSMFNPANTGLHYKHYGNLVYRAQWDKVENAPNSITAIYETKLNKINSGIGIGYLRDEIGLGTEDHVYFNYAYHIPLKNSKLSFGTSVVLGRVAFDPQWNAPQTGTQPGLDPSLPSGSGFAVGFNFGTFYKRERLEIGLSSSFINQPRYDNVNFTKARHYFAMVGYEIKLSKYIDLKPRLYLKTDGTAAAMEINTLFTYQKNYWLGLTYRRFDAFALHAGIDFYEKFRIGYSYDFMTNKTLGQYGSGSHEIVLGIMLK